MEGLGESRLRKSGRLEMNSFICSFMKGPNARRPSGYPTVGASQRCDPTAVTLWMTWRGYLARKRMHFNILKI